MLPQETEGKIGELLAGSLGFLEQRLSRTERDIVRAIQPALEFVYEKVFDGYSGLFDELDSIVIERGQSPGASLDERAQYAAGLKLIEKDYRTYDGYQEIKERRKALTGERDILVRQRKEQGRKSTSLLQIMGTLMRYYDEIKKSQSQTDIALTEKLGEGIENIRDASRITNTALESIDARIGEIQDQMTSLNGIHNEYSEVSYRLKGFREIASIPYLLLKTAKGIIVAFPSRQDAVAKGYGIAYELMHIFENANVKVRYSPYATLLFHTRLESAVVDEINKRSEFFEKLRIGLERFPSPDHSDAVNYAAGFGLEKRVTQKTTKKPIVDRSKDTEQLYHRARRIYSALQQYRPNFIDDHVSRFIQVFEKMDESKPASIKRRELVTGILEEGLYGEFSDMYRSLLELRDQFKRQGQEIPELHGLRSMDSLAYYLRVIGAMIYQKERERIGDKAEDFIRTINGASTKEANLIDRIKNLDPDHPFINYMSEWREDLARGSLDGLRKRYNRELGSTEKGSTEKWNRFVYNVQKTQQKKVWVRPPSKPPKFETWYGWVLLFASVRRHIYK